jgi:methyl-accepting chemotaxis protein
MGISALVIHVCNGLIEAHFELFVMIALLTVYGRVAALLTAGVTIALHHVLFWIWLPASVFNYQASIAIVLLHAFFVVLEVVPACWIAQQFGHAVKMQGIVKEQLGSAVDRVAASAKDMSTTSSNLSHAASDQASAIEETSASTVELNEIASRTAEESESALKLMSEMGAQLMNANRDLRTMQGVVKEMVVSSGKIGKIVKMIDGIAFQTNILALNAAVEAATAGAYGAGFSVVATEVGSLAHRSAAAASDSAELIDLALQNTQTGERVARELGLAMERATLTAEMVRVRITSMQSDSQTQCQAGAAIKQSMIQLGDSSQSTAAGAEQSAAAGLGLEEQAAQLRGIVALLQG